MFSLRALGALLVAAAALSVGAAGFIVRPAPVQATTASADVVLIRTNDVVTEDLYASGLRIDVRGTVEGDLVAAALGEVRISGIVDGDVIVVGRTVIIEGDVRGSVRAITGQLTVSGVVAGDVVGAAADIDITGTVGGDVLGAMVGGVIDGSVGRDARLEALRSVVVNGSVGRDLELNARTLTIGGGAVVDGDVRYRARASISEDARLSGLVLELGDTPIPLRVKAIGLVGGLVGVAIVILTGLGALWLLGERVAAASRAARRWPVALAVGLTSLAAPPLLLSILPVAVGAASPDLSVPIVLAMLPLWIAWLALAMLGMVLGWIPVATALGTVVVQRRSAHAQLVVGAAVLVAVWFIPVVGSALLGLAWLVGLGGWLMGARRGRQTNTTDLSSATNTPMASSG